MTALASWMARTLWRAVLWLQRRPWMKRLQKKSMLLVPPAVRSRAAKGLVRQNRFARKIGLPMLTFMMSLVVGSLLVTGSFLLAMHLYESGYLSVPRRIRRQLFID